MFALAADSGWVIALHVLMVSPEIPVGVHSDGFVPIVQKRMMRFDCLTAACAGLRVAMLMNGASRSPAPTLPANCLRLNLRMVVVLLLVLDALGEVLRVDDRHQRRLQAEAAGLRLVVDRVVRALS